MIFLQLFFFKFTLYSDSIHHEYYLHDWWVQYCLDSHVINPPSSYIGVYADFELLWTLSHDLLT